MSSLGNPICYQKGERARVGLTVLTATARSWSEGLRKRSSVAPSSARGRVPPMPFDHGEDFFLGEDVVAELCHLEDRVDQAFDSRDAAFFEPVGHVAYAAHRTDADLLGASGESRGGSEGRER